MIYSQDPAQIIEQTQEQGTRCYDCLHHRRTGVGLRRGVCIKRQPGYPNEGKSTCVNFIYRNPPSNEENANE